MSHEEWRLPDEWWERIQPLLPPGKEHPLGCHRSRLDDRRVMDAVLLVLRSQMPWNALDAPHLCSASTAYRRYREWRAAGVFRRLYDLGVAGLPPLRALDWSTLTSTTRCRRRGRQAKG